MPTTSPTNPSPTPANVAEAAEGRTNLFSLRRKYIVPAVLPDGERLNTRTDFGDLDTLARSIARHGIKTALLGTWRDGHFHADDGERRMKAYDLAVAEHGLDPASDLGLIPVNRQAKGYTDAERTVDLLTCNLGQPLNPFERALSMVRLSGYGYDEIRIAAETAYSRTHVRDCLRLATATAPGVQRAVASGLMSFSLAVELAQSVSCYEEQENLLAAARAAAQEAGAERITARHLPKPAAPDAVGHPPDFGDPGEPDHTPPPLPAPIPTSVVGRSAEDRDLLIQGIELVRSEGQASISLLQRRLHLGFQQASALLDAMVGHGLLDEETHAVLMCDAEIGTLLDGLRPAEVFGGKDVAAPYLDDAGRFIDEVRMHPVLFTTPGVTGSVHLATHLEKWYAGFTLKWPAARREDGFLKVAVSTKNPPHGNNAAAELQALMDMRAELEVKDFEGRPLAVQELSSRIQRLADALPATAPDHLPNPVLPPPPSALEILDNLLADIPASDAEKDRLKTVKIVRGLLAGKHERKEVAKYLLGIVDKVDVVKGGAR